MYIDMSSSHYCRKTMKSQAIWNTFTCIQTNFVWFDSCRTFPEGLLLSSSSTRWYAINSLFMLKLNWTILSRKIYMLNTFIANTEFSSRKNYVNCSHLNNLFLWTFLTNCFPDIKNVLYTWFLAPLILRIKIHFPYKCILKELVSH